MNFVKMHGLGNDFIVFENLNDSPIDYKRLAVKVCDRHFGVGADGILIVRKSNVADIRMEIINSDGSLAEMCGNGIRCFCKYVYEKGIVNRDVMQVETMAGVLTANLRIEEAKVLGVRVNMGEPVFDKEKIPFASDKNNLLYSLEVDGEIYRASTILMGVPHTVIYREKLDIKEVENIGRKIERLDIFPARTNVNFIEIVDKNTIKIRTWERGAGLTQACGTGTCASVVAGAVNNITRNIVTAELSGGRMFIEYDGRNVFMEGPAEFVCEGTLYI